MRISPVVLALVAIMAPGCTRPDSHPVIARLILAVPLGASPQDAARELDSAGVRHGTYDAQSRTITAIAKFDSTSIVHTDIQMTLVFSPDGRLEKRVFGKLYTGP
jgi:hypothetical protein